VRLLHADALDVLPYLEPVDTIITDPVWPNCGKVFPGFDAFGVFAAAAHHFPRLCRRLVVVLAVDSDPRFLSAVPRDLPFFRACWLRFIPPRYRGTLLAGADIAYVFGSRHLCGQKRVIPGEFQARFDGKTTPSRSEHPCPRNLAHMRWLVENYTRPAETILDPFMGSGTTGLAARDLGRHFVGIEHDAGFFAVARSRLESGQVPLVASL